VTLVYVYAVLPQPIDAEIEGIGGARVRWVVHDGLAAAVSDVAAEDFEEEPLNANVRDMAWLGPRAVAHQDVNARLFEKSDALVPLAFGTVFRDESRVQQLLTDRSAVFTSRLQKVRGCGEWVAALHLLREPDREDVAAASPLVQKLRSDIASSSPGRAHLLRQQLARAERDESRRVQAEAATHLLARLRSVAVDVYPEPLPTDAVEKPLLRASVLVRRDTESEFIDQIDALRRRWPEPTYRLLLTGPWPPYRFAGLGEPGRDE
jgi:hypothetical protein